MWYKRLKDGWRSLGNEPGLDLQSTSLNDYVTSQESTLIMHDHRVTIREFSNEVLTLTINYILRVSSHFCFCFLVNKFLTFELVMFGLVNKFLTNPTLPWFVSRFSSSWFFGKTKLKRMEVADLRMSNCIYVDQNLYSTNHRQKKNVVFFFCIKIHILLFNLLFTWVTL